jgi:hypothetical protein
MDTPLQTSTKVLSAARRVQSVAGTIAQAACSE